MCASQSTGNNCHINSLGSLEDCKSLRNLVLIFIGPEALLSPCIANDRSWKTAHKIYGILRSGRRRIGHWNGSAW
jgi:hypothetical protein